MSNRVEDLEQQVAELQAAVNGLTEELVETKARVRQLEDDREADVERRAQPAAGPVHADEAAAATSTDATATDAAAAPSERTTHSDDHTHVVERTDAGEPGSESSDVDGAVSDSDDMVVAEQDVTTPDAEAAKSEERGGEDEQESDTSDIIIA